MVKKFEDILTEKYTAASDGIVFDQVFVPGAAWEAEATIAKYTTVEGHPIVRDGEYETRDGRKAKVIYFEENFIDYPVIALIARADLNQWRANGSSKNLSQRDLMRPWVEAKKEEEKKPKNCYCWTESDKWKKCCGKEESKKPEKQKRCLAVFAVTNYPEFMANNIKENAVITIISEWAEERLKQNEG